MPRKIARRDLHLRRVLQLISRVAVAVRFHFIDDLRDLVGNIRHVRTDIFQCFLYVLPLISTADNLYAVRRLDFIERVAVLVGCQLCVDIFESLLHVLTVVSPAENIDFIRALRVAGRQRHGVAAGQS